MLLRDAHVVDAGLDQAGASLASAASNRMRTVWPANAFRLALAAVQAPLRLLAAPSDWKTCVEVVPDTTKTRKKSALEEFEPWAR